MEEKLKAEKRGKIGSFLERHKGVINAFISVIFIIYFLLNFASYYLGGIKEINDFVTSSKFSYGTKFLSYAIMFPYLLLVYLANGCQIKKIPILLYILTIGGQLIALFTVPRSIHFSWINAYNMPMTTTYELGYLSQLIDLINAILDFVIMYFYVHVFREMNAGKKTYAFYYFVILFTLACVIYSFKKEWADYKAMATVFDGNARTYSIHSTFYSENSFGVLLFGGFLASFYLFIKRHYWTAITALLFFVTSLFSFCRSSFFSILAFVAIYMLVRLVQLAVTNRKKFFIYFSLSGMFVLLVLFVIYPALSGLPCTNSFFRPIVDVLQSDFVQKLLKLNQKVFLDSLENGTYSGRKEIWKFSYEMVKWPYLLCGYGKTLSNDMLVIYSSYKYFAFHSVYAATYAYYGVIGCLCYLSAIGYSIYYSLKKKVCFTSGALAIAALGSALIYGSMEVFHILLSTSSVMLVANVMIATPEEKEPGKLIPFLKNKFVKH